MEGATTRRERESIEYGVLGGGERERESMEQLYYRVRGKVL